MLSVPMQAIINIVFKSIVLAPTLDTVSAQHRLFLKTSANAKAASKKKSKKLAKINPVDTSKMRNISNDIDSESKYDSTITTERYTTGMVDVDSTTTMRSGISDNNLTDSINGSMATPTKNTILVSYDFIKKRSKVLKHCLPILQQQRWKEQQMDMVSPITIITIDTITITTIITNRRTIVQLTAIASPMPPNDSR